MLLSVKERILILNILPKPGEVDLPTMRIKSGLEHLIGFSSEEFTELEMNTNEEGTFWNDAKETHKKEFNLTDDQFTLIKTIFDRMEYIGLIKRFCLGVE